MEIEIFVLKYVSLEHIPGRQLVIPTCWREQLSNGMPSLLGVDITDSIALSILGALPATMPKPQYLHHTAGRKGLLVGSWEMQMFPECKDYCPVGIWVDTHWGANTTCQTSFVGGKEPEQPQAQTAFWEGCYRKWWLNKSAPKTWCCALRRKQNIHWEELMSNLDCAIIWSVHDPKYFQTLIHKGVR